MTTPTAKSIKEAGLGRIVAAYQESSIHTNLYLHDNDRRAGKILEKLLRVAFTRAMNTLRRNEELLVRLADYLSDHSLMRHDQILAQVVKFMPDFKECADLKRGEKGYYRERLKLRVRERSSHGEF